MEIPETLINAAVYLNDKQQIGIADAELPSLEPVTQTTSGMGVAGEIETPVIGHWKSMSLKLKYRVLNKQNFELIKPGANQMTLRGSIQSFDPKAGTYKNYAVRVLVKTLFKKGALGKLEPAKAQDVEHEHEVIYLKVWLNDTEVLEVDKINMIYISGGTDHMADIREHLGM